MREILFRGKRKDNGEWIEGYIVKLGKESFSDPERYGICNKAIPIGGSAVCYNLKIDEVIPETVGQFTGLTDKNDNKIFEGDIISAITLDTGNEQTAVVCFGNFIDENNGDEYIGFFIDFDGIKTTITQLAMEECKNRIEVIGNIYDNPELLKVE